MVNVMKFEILNHFSGRVEFTAEIECSNGIHFFITREEAEAWQRNKHSTHSYRCRTR